jgi:hypothetical protein
MKRLLCLVVMACLFMLSTSSGIFALNRPYQWQDPSIDNESHPWGGDESAPGGGPLKTGANDYRMYTDNWSLDLIINTIVRGWNQTYRPSRSFLPTTTTQTQTTQPTTVNTTNRGN